MLKRGIAISAMALVGTVTIHAAVRSPEARTGTVGEFVVQLAAAMGQDAKSIQTASRSLERLGVSLSVGAETPLTHGFVERIAADLGIGVVAPSAPQETVSAARASVLASLMGTSFVEHGPGAVSVDLPAECLRSENRGECVECCKEAVGQVPDDEGNLRDPGRECAMFCQNIPRPPVSDSEPQN